MSGLKKFILVFNKISQAHFHRTGNPLKATKPQQICENFSRKATTFARKYFGSAYNPAPPSISQITPFVHGNLSSLKKFHSSIFPIPLFFFVLLYYQRHLYFFKRENIP
jgi:hypothetical protein